MQFVMYTGKLYIYQHSFFITYNIYISKHTFPITILQNILCKCAKSFSFWETVPQTRYRGFAPGPHWGTYVPEPPDWPVFILGLSGEFPNPQKFRNPPKI